MPHIYYVGRVRNGRMTVPTTLGEGVERRFQLVNMRIRKDLPAWSNPDEDHTFAFRVEPDDEDEIAMAGTVTVPTQHVRTLAELSATLNATTPGAVATFRHVGARGRKEQYLTMTVKPNVQLYVLSRPMAGILGLEYDPSREYVAGAVDLHPDLNYGRRALILELEGLSTSYVNGEARSLVACVPYFAGSYGDILEWEEPHEERLISLGLGGELRFLFSNEVGDVLTGLNSAVYLHATLD